MWGFILNKTYKLNDRQYLDWVKPRFVNLHNTLEKFTEVCRINNNSLYKKAIWCQEINDLVVATSLTEPRLAKFDKEGYFTVVMEKRQYITSYEEAKLVYNYWLKNHHDSEYNAVSEQVLTTLYTTYAKKIKKQLGITNDKFFNLVYNRDLTEYNYIENPIDETINPFEFILKSFK